MGCNNIVFYNEINLGQRYYDLKHALFWIYRLVLNVEILVFDCSGLISKLFQHGTRVYILFPKLG